jgi:hypothetical protein
VFAIRGTATRVLALHEGLGAWRAGEPFYHVVESPYDDFDDGAASGYAAPPS